MSSTLVSLLRPGNHICKSFSASRSVKEICLRSTTMKAPHSAALSTSVEVKPEESVGGSQQKMSNAMKAYMEQARIHNAFVSELTAEYEIGRRHLANIMGEDPEAFTDEDRDKAIAYLFPSGLFEPHARPFMKHPSDIIAKRKAAEFNENGRPFHTLFYTGRPNYYQVLHEITEKVQELDEFANRMTQYNVSQDQSKTLDIESSEWINLEELGEKILEPVRDYQYEFFLKSMNRLVAHPFSYRVSDFILNFRKEKTTVQELKEIPKLMYTAEGVPYMTSSGRKKTATATVTVYGRGSGKIEINGQDIHYFSNMQDREQIVFPLQFSNMLGTVDVVAEVKGGGTTGQSGVVRYCISMCLRSFVDSEMMEKMRIAGLLTPDLRNRERKKPGQKGARAKFTWKKR